MLCPAKPTVLSLCESRFESSGSHCNCLAIHQKAPRWQIIEAFRDAEWRYRLVPVRSQGRPIGKRLRLGSLSARHLCSRGARWESRTPAGVTRS